MSAPASSEVWVAREIDRLLTQLDTETAKDMGSDLSRLADRIEHCDDSIGEAQPMEVADAVSAIGRLELAAASELRRLTASDRPASFDPRLRANLLLLRRCGRRRRFQELRTGWLENLGDGD